MTRILFDEDGNEIEVPDEKELEGLKLAAKKNKERKKALKELEEKIKDYEADDGKRNFRALRKKADALEKALKKLGKTVDDKGEIVDIKGKIDPDKLLEEAKKAARSELIQNKIDTALSKIQDEDQRKVVKHYFEKLSAGEELDLEKVDKYLGQAAKLATPEGDTNNSLKDILNLDGGTSRSGGGGEVNFAETEEGKALAEDLGLTLEVPKDNGGGKQE